MSKNDKFTYSYSAPTASERLEIEDIRRRYSEKTEREDALTHLKNLDKKVKRFPFVFAMVLGIAGCLIFGLGLAMVLEWKLIIGGAAVSVIGAAIMAVNYPIYKAILNRNKRKYGEEIVKLSNELLNE